VDAAAGDLDQLGEAGVVVGAQLQARGAQDEVAQGPVGAHEAGVPARRRGDDRH
jgi:hypothetical protein